MVIDRSDKNRVCIFCFWQLNIDASRKVIEFPCAFAVHFGGRNTLTPMGATCFAEFEVLLGGARLSASGVDVVIGVIATVGGVDTTGGKTTVGGGGGGKVAFACHCVGRT